MGIRGLLQVLKTTTSPVHIKEYNGKVAAVDTYSWLHKGAYTCSRELCHGLPTTKFIDYCLQRVNLLRQFGVRPLLVFDGGRLPMKEEQENKRARSRKLNLEQALEHEERGNMAAAHDYYRKAVDITPKIAFELIKVLQAEHIPYIVAPYEADAQLAFLSIQGLADVIITEDGDSIPFGCSKVLFKMDKFGLGVEYQYNNLVKNKELDFTNFTKEMILEMCILSGCDYLPSLQGMGIKRAHGLVKRFRSYQKVIKHLKYNGVSVPSSYEDLFSKAILTFHHQPVYDPVIEDIVTLTPLPFEFSQSLLFLGNVISRELGQAIARGEIDPDSKMPFEPAANVLTPKNGSPVRQRKRALNLPIQKNLLTNYFLSASTEAKRHFKAPRTFGPGTVSVEVKDDFQCSKADGPFAETLDLTNENFSSAIHLRSSEFMLSADEENQVLDFLSSKMVCTDLPLSLKKNLAESENKEEKKASVAKGSFVKKSGGKCIVQSAYFSKSKVVGKSLESTDLELSPSDSVSVEDEGFFPSLDTKSVGNPANTTFERLLKSSLYEGQDAADKVISETRLPSRRSGQQADQISVGEKKHTPNFSSKLLGNNGLPQTFASDVSHVEQYAAIAQKSMERFVSTIAPFRCPAPGARASGLRRPAKAGGTQKPNRFPSKASKAVEDLRQFAFTQSSCRLSLGKTEAVLRSKSVASLEEYSITGWD